MDSADTPREYEFLTTTAFARKLRKSRTPAEMAMWEIIHRPEFAEWRFRQQSPVRSYFADIAARSIKLVIELDGESHDKRPEHEEAREKSLTEAGRRVLRFTNEDVINRPDEVARIVLNECRGRPRFRY